MGRNYSKVLTIILGVIIVAVVGLLGFLAYNYYSKYNINKNAEKYVESFVSGEVVDTPTEPTNNTGDDTNLIVENPSTQENNVDNNTTTGKKTSKYKGFDSLGTIVIPKTDCRYPILAKVTKKSLENSVAVVWPEEAELNKVGNVVIVGHNYRNGMFFSNNKKLSKGDNIYITDLDGKRVTYSIYNIFETTEIDTSFYNRDTDGKREITLSTCTDDSSARLIIEAVEKE